MSYTNTGPRSLSEILGLGRVPGFGIFSDCSKVTRCINHILRNIPSGVGAAHRNQTHYYLCSET